MNTRTIFFGFTMFAIGTAEASIAEYECDEGNIDAGYRIRVVELSRDIREVTVLKKTKGSAHVVVSKKLKRAGGSASTPRFESVSSKGKLSFKKSLPDSAGTWTGIFSIPDKRGTKTVRAECNFVETLSM